MTEFLAGLSLWLVDYFVAATALLAVAALALWRTRQPATRMALAWGTMIGLTVLAASVALPCWPRINVAVWAAAGSADDISALPKPVVSVAEQEFPLAVQNYEQDADRPAAPATAADEPALLATIVRTGSAFTWHTWTALAWMALAAMALCWIALGAAQAWRMMWTARPSPEWTHAELARIVSHRRRPRLKTSTRISSAVALGTLRPAILLPHEHVREDNRSAVQAALAHEWAHIRHGDLWLLAWQRLLLPLLAVHPLFWLLRRQIRSDQELLADLAAAGERPVEYAEALLAWAKEARPQPSASLAVLAMWENPQTVSRRIQMILDPKNPKPVQTSRWWRWVLVLSFVAIACGLSVLSLRTGPAVAQEDAAGGGTSQDSDWRLHLGDPLWTSARGATLQQVELSVTLVRLGSEGEVATQESVLDLAKHFGDGIGFDNGVCVVALPRQQVDSALKALLDGNQATILAEPTLMTISGRDAFFADGGEIPSIRETDFGDRRIETIEYHSRRSLRIRPEIKPGSKVATVRLSVTRETTEILDDNARQASGEAEPRMVKRQLTSTADVPVGRTLLVWELKPAAADSANLVLITPEGIHQITREVLAAPRSLTLDYRFSTTQAAAIQTIDPKAAAQVQAAEKKLQAEANQNAQLAERLKAENATLRQQVHDLLAQIARLRSAAQEEPKNNWSDVEFIRRAYLDLTGTLPGPDDVKAFLDQKDARKRQILLDKLLSDAAVADHWSRLWKQKIMEPRRASADPNIAGGTQPATELPPTPANQVTVFQLRHMPSDRAAALAKELLELGQSGSARLVSDPRTNSLMFNGPEKQAQILQSILKVLDQPTPVDDDPLRASAPQSQNRAAEHDLATQRQLLELDLQTAETDLDIAKSELEDAKDVAKKVGTAISAAELRHKEAAVRHAELRRRRTMILLEAAQEKQKPAPSSGLNAIEEGLVPPKNLPERIWNTLGLALEPADQNTFKKLNSAYRGGLTVTDVRPGSPADERGLVKGDILVGLDRWEMRSLENIAYVLEHEDIQEAGGFSFYILRNGKSLVGRMLLADAARASPASPLPPKSDAPPPAAAAEDRVLNIRLAELDLKQAQLKLEADEKQLARISDLAAKNSVSQTEVDAARIAAHQSKLEVERAATVLEGLQKQPSPVKP